MIVNYCCNSPTRMQGAGASLTCSDGIGSANDAHVEHAAHPELACGTISVTAFHGECLSTLLAGAAPDIGSGLRALLLGLQLKVHARLESMSCWPYSHTRSSTSCIR